MLSNMSDARADIVHWARAQRRAAGRIAREAREQERNLAAALARVDELRAFADNIGAGVERERAERENLAFHLAWKRVRRALGIG